TRCAARLPPASDDPGSLDSPRPRQSTHALHRRGGLLPVGLGVRLGDPGGAMAQHDPRHLDVKLATQGGRRIVPQLAGVPPRDPAVRAGALDGVIIRPCAVTVPGRLPRGGLANPGLLRRGLWRPPVATALGQMLLLRLTRLEQVLRRVRAEPRPEDLLGP